MTFDLDDQTQRARAVARQCATALATEFDHRDPGRSMPAAVAKALAAMPGKDDPLTWAVCLEELCVAPAAVAVELAAGPAPLAAGSGGTEWPGLRGTNLIHARAVLTGSDVGSLSASVVLMGLGRAVLELTLSGLRAARDGGIKVEQSQWLVADAAVAIDAARLMTWNAADGMRSRPTSAAAPLAMARLLSDEAAQLAVSAARHAMPAEAFSIGTALERIARDIDTALLLFGTSVTSDAAIAPGDSSR